MTTNNDDTQNEVLGITLKDSKNNELSVKNTSEVITPDHPQTNNDDTNYYSLELDDMVIALNNKDEIIEELKDRNNKLAEMVDILRSGNIGNLGYKIKNQRHEINNRLKEIDKLKSLLRECRDMINNHCSWQVMDRPNHYVKKIENDIYEPLLTKIDEVLK